MSAGRVDTGPRAPRASRPRRAVLAGWLPGTMLAREWLVSLSRTRALVIRAAVPLLLAAPLVAGGAPSFWAGTLLTVLVAMTGAVGSGMTVARARQSGLLTRLAVVPARPTRVVGGWLVAAAVVDLCQLAPALAVVVVAGGGPAAAAPALMLAVGAVLLLTNVLGCALALLADGAAEVLLDVAVVLAPLLFLAGIFTGVPRTGAAAVVARLDPVSAVHSGVVGALGGDPAYAAGEVALAAAAWLLAGLLLVPPLAGAVLSRR